MRPALTLAVVLALLTATPAAPATASDAPLWMTNVSVEGGEGSWHPSPEFRVRWDTAVAPSEQVAAVDHRILDPLGAEVPFSRIRTPYPGHSFSARVPDRPGVYTVEAWLEAASGGTGPHVTARLRFDDAAPGAASPLPPGGWVAGSTHAAIGVEHPSGPPPISGIGGYAYSIDRDEDGPAPCAGAKLCTPAETDLDGDAGDDRFAAPLLPEGTSYVHLVAVSGSGVRSTAVGTAPIRVDAGYPQVRLDGVPAGWSDRPVVLTATAADRLSGMEPSGPDGPFTAIALDDAAPTRRQGAFVTAVVRGDGVHTAAYFARDAAGNVADGTEQAPKPATATVRIDETPPRVAFAAPDPADPERIEATVADPLSGPSPDRGSIEIRPAGTAAAFTPLPTAVRDGRLLARWSSDDAPAGRYELRVTGWDVAGNAATTTRRADGAEMILANPVKEPVLLEAGFGGRKLVWQRCRRRRGSRRCHRQVLSDFGSRPLVRAVPFGHGIAYAGRLRTAAGAPVGGAEVSVVEEFAAGAAVARRTTAVRTDAEGFFVVRLGPGPSRRIGAAFAGDRRLGRGSGGAVSLGVLAAVRLAASSPTARIGGRPIAFRGRVLPGEAHIPAAGRPVELQFRYPGARWSEFRTVHTRPSGRFRYPYSFSDGDSRGVRFQFRACAPPQPDWPYQPSCSRPVAVTGR
jgi:hypothetical protein